MKNLLSVRTFIFFGLFLIFGIAALYGCDAVSLAKDERPEIDRLFEDMLILKVPHVTDPVEITLKDINNKDVSLSDFRGKIVFLNFWTTWCPTCRIEMPSMERLNKKLKDRDFAMVTVNLQESAPRVKNFFKRFKLTFTALLDTTGEVGAMFSVYQIPTTYILDKTGHIIGKAVGPREWDRKKPIALFEHLTDRYAATSTSGLVN